MDLLDPPLLPPESVEQPARPSAIPPAMMWRNRRRRAAGFDGSVSELIFASFVSEVSVMTKFEVVSLISLDMRQGRELDVLGIVRFDAKGLRRAPDDLSTSIERASA